MMSCCHTTDQRHDCRRRRRKRSPCSPTRSRQPLLVPLLVTLCWHALMIGDLSLCAAAAAAEADALSADSSASSAARFIRRKADRHTMVAHNRERRELATQDKEEEEEASWNSNLGVGREIQQSDFNEADNSTTKQQPNNIMTDQTIREAVQIWCDNPTLAEQYYGHIRDWNTSAVTVMRTLFRKQYVDSSILVEVSSGFRRVVILTIPFSSSLGLATERISTTTSRSGIPARLHPWRLCE
jgi:hypothetical protein